MASRTTKEKVAIPDEALWQWKGQPVQDSDIPDDAVGFCYLIIHRPTRKIYVGKKHLSAVRRSRISKREKVATKTRKTYKVTRKDSGWRNYWSSCDELKVDVQKYGMIEFARVIYAWAHSKKHLTYLELKTMFQFDIMEKDSYNGNLMGTIYKRDLVPPQITTNK